MNEEAATEAPPRRRRRRPGCLLTLALVVVAVTGLVIAIGFAFDQGDSARRPTTEFEAGNADGFPAPSVNQFEPQRLFITRLADGSFIALYDESSRQQELGSDCRVIYDETAGLGNVEPLPGLRGAFVEECEGSRAVWRADGMYVSGNAYGPLDRFGTRVDADGHLIVDMSSRACLRSRGVIGVGPFDEKRC